MLVYLWVLTGAGKLDFLGLSVHVTLRLGLDTNGDAASYIPSSSYFLDVNVFVVDFSDSHGIRV
jgi:hypothetical protein